MDLPITVSRQVEIPLFLQIKYQLSYLIASNKLREGSRMPAVREIATDLKISPMTVLQAYKALHAEGLIVSVNGKGTFVAEKTTPTGDERQRQELLNRTLEPVFRNAAALGFNQNELHQRFLMALGNADMRTRLAFIGPSPTTADKYAQSLERHFPEQVIGTPIAVDDLQNPSQQLRQEVRDHYFFIAPARMEREVKEGLDPLLEDYFFLGITVSVTDETVRRLAQLDPEAPMCLVTERRYVNSSLSTISSNSSISIDSIAIAFDTEREKILRLAHASAVVFHTSGVRVLLDQLELPPGRRFELGLDFSPESLHRLSRLLKP